MEIRVLPDEVSAATATARSIAVRLRDAVGRRSRASLALSGGSTPGLMLDALARVPLPWRSIDIVQVDERRTALGSADRNASQILDRLVGVLRGDRPRVHLLPVETEPPEQAQEEASSLLDGLAPLDVVHLGLGDDGHTASWPPGSDVADHPGSVAWVPEFRGFQRMTLTASVVNGARSRLLLVTGSGKSAALRRWLDGDPTVPIQRLRRTRLTVFADEGAARGLADGISSRRPQARR